MGEPCGEGTEGTVTASPFMATVAWLFTLIALLLAVVAYKKADPPTSLAPTTATPMVAAPVVVAENLGDTIQATPMIPAAETTNKTANKASKNLNVEEDILGGLQPEPMVPVATNASTTAKTDGEVVITQDTYRSERRHQ